MGQVSLGLCFKHTNLTTSIFTDGHLWVMDSVNHRKGVG